MENTIIKEGLPHLNKLVIEHNELIDEYEHLYQDYENTIAQNQKLTERISVLATNLETTNEYCNTINADLKRVKSELAVYNDSNRDASLVGQIKALTLKLNESNKEVKVLTTQLKELKGVNSKIKTLQKKFADNKEAIDNYSSVKKEVDALRKYSDLHKDLLKRMKVSIMNSNKSTGYYPVVFSEKAEKEKAVQYAVEVSPIALFTQTRMECDGLKIIKIHDFEVLVHGSDGVIYQVDLTEIGTFSIAIPAHLNVNPTGITYTTIKEVAFKLTTMLSQIESKTNTVLKDAINALFDIKIKGIIDDEFCKVLKLLKVDNLYQAICLLSNVSPDCFITSIPNGFDPRVVIKENLDKCIQYCKDNDNVIFIKPIMKPERKGLIPIKTRR